LAVRDLSSRNTVEYLALRRGTGPGVLAVLKRLFLRFGAPLVLKSDNGSCFVAAGVRGLLARFGVVHLRSPRAWPQYNGACEAGIGLLRALSDAAAASRGDPDSWTMEDLEEARARANDLVRRGDGPRATARELWKRRKRPTRTDRRRFRVALDRELRQLAKRDPAPRRHRARIRRKAIQQVLVDLGHLEVRSGWVRARSTGRGAGPSYR
jgi:hypothetical protein